jgi:predicted RNA-binding protein with PIN domain/phage shock protein A
VTAADDVANGLTDDDSGAQAVAEVGSSEHLPDRVRSRLVDLAADCLGRLPDDDVPPSLKRIASFAPSRRGKLAGNQILAVLSQDPVFRRRLAEELRARMPELVTAIEDQSATPEENGDLVDRAAVAYLLGRPDWASIAASAAQVDTPEQPHPEATRQVERLQRQLDAVLEEAKAARRRNRDQVTDLKRQNAELRHKLGETRARVRAAEESAARADAAVVDLTAAATAAASGHEAELRRLRTRIEDLESELSAVRRTERAERGSEALRARLLLDTLLDTAQGLRRELALPAVSTTPADEVEAHIAEEGSRASSGHGSLTSDDPVLLDQLLALPRAHLIVDGYNVTKSAWPDLSLERQRDRLLAGLAPLTARSGAEVTVVFDASGIKDRPVVNRPRGVRVLYSPAGVIADDVIRQLVAAEPQGRPVVVVSSDQEVARDVARAGARAVASMALARLLTRS